MTMIGTFTIAQTPAVGNVAQSLYQVSLKTKLKNETKLKKEEKKGGGGNFHIIPVQFNVFLFHHLYLHIWY